MPNADGTPTSFEQALDQSRKAYTERRNADQRAGDVQDALDSAQILGMIGAGLSGGMYAPDEKTPSAPTPGGGTWVEVTLCDDSTMEVLARNITP